MLTLLVFCDAISFFGRVINSLTVANVMESSVCDLMMPSMNRPSFVLAVTIR